MSSDVPFIETVQLTKRFQRHYALHRLGLHLDAGKIHLVLGPNGAGKSTLLSILATLDQPTSGTVKYGPKLGSAQVRRGHRGLFGWVSHENLVYPDLTAIENLRFFAQLYRLKDVDGSIEAHLERLDLADSASRRVRTFSRGMMQRLTIARCLLHDPQILLLDEPFSGLDLRGRAIVVDVLKEARDRGRLIILSTHILDLDSTFVDQIVVLKRGRLCYSGAPKFPLSEFYQEVLSGRPARS